MQSVRARAHCRTRIAALFAIWTVSWLVAALPLPARAEWSASLPLFKACMPSSPPQMPERWRAVGLMMPFERGQLDIGEFVFDGALPAMRATIYGLESGAADVLITDQDTYLLHGPHDAPTGCTSLGPKLRMPSAQWLSEGSECVGQSPLASHEVQWWKKPGFDIARYWISPHTGLPWRSWFLRRTLDPAVIGDYAMTYFPTFTPLPQTGLAPLRDLCTRSATPAVSSIGPTPTARELMKLGDAASTAERDQRIAELIPGLTHNACKQMTPVRWPDRFVTTAMVTPTQITDRAYSTLIYYDWRDAQTMLILPFHGSPPALQGLLTLKKGVGYRIRFHPSSSKPPVCAAVLPGAVKPDWMTVASCRCRGVIEGNPALSPDGAIQILSCPIKLQGERVMWNWYTTHGRPIMFTEAAPEGSGVMLADYQDWIPGQTGKPEDFMLPSACVKPGNAAGAAAATPTFSHPSCSDCHSTPW